MLTTPDLVISEQFVGPPNLGNGGYVVGAMAEALLGDSLIGGGPVEVTLRAPLPIDTPFGFSREGDTLSLNNGDALLATARPAALDLNVPAPAGREAVLENLEASPSLKVGIHQTLGERLGVHPICFCCGAEREEGDGLRVFPTATEGDADVTALWTPHANFARADGTVGLDIIGAAIDCPGAFAFIIDGDRAGLLGRMTVEVVKPLKTGEESTIIGWRTGKEGRKLLAGTAIFDATGALVARASQVWFGFPSTT